MMEGFTPHAQGGTGHGEIWKTHVWSSPHTRREGPLAVTWPPVLIRPTNQNLAEEVTWPAGGVVKQSSSCRNMRAVFARSPWRSLWA